MKYFSFIALALGASLALAEPTNSSDSQKANIQELQKELEILRLQKELDSLKNANTTNPQSTHNLSKNEQKAQRKAQKQAKKQSQKKRQKSPMTTRWMISTIRLNCQKKEGNSSRKVLTGGVPTWATKTALPIC